MNALVTEDAVHVRFKGDFGPETWTFQVFMVCVGVCV